MLSARSTRKEHLRPFALDPQGASAAIRALSAELLSVCQREAAMIARYDAKLAAAEARAESVDGQLVLEAAPHPVDGPDDARAWLASLEGDKP